MFSPPRSGAVAQVNIISFLAHTINNEHRKNSPKLIASLSKNNNNTKAYKI
jgi:hypothetical protein